MQLKTKLAGLNEVKRMFPFFFVCFKTTYETEIILLPRLKGHIHVAFDVVVTACNTQNAQSKQSLIILISHDAWHVTQQASVLKGQYTAAFQG